MRMSVRRHPVSECLKCKLTVCLPSPQPATSRLAIELNLVKVDVVLPKFNQPSEDLESCSWNQLQSYKPFCPCCHMLHKVLLDFLFQ